LVGRGTQISQLWIGGPFRSAVSQLRTGHSPCAIAITPDGKTAYVANSGSGTVTPIRTATNTALKPIKVGLVPIAIAITP